MEDMAVVYRFVLESNDTGRASILVTNDMIDHMGVTHEQLKADALENGRNRAVRLHDARRCQQKRRNERHKSIFSHRL